MTEYTPSTEEVRTSADWGAFTSPDEFDRWFAEYTRQVAERAWDEGFKAGWAECADPDPFVNDVWDSKTPNPYRKEATGV